MQQNRVLVVETKLWRRRLPNMKNKPASEAITQAERDLNETHAIGRFTRRTTELKLLRPVAKYPLTRRSNAAMASEKNLQELFHETLKDIYFAEKKILGALPKMAKAAQSEDLKAAFEKHETETEEHVARLEKVFHEIDSAPRGKTCDAIMGIIEEGQEVMKEFKGAPALDAGLLAAAQAVEHYEIARYGTLKTWAAELGLNQAVKLLETTLSEEKKTDETLTQLAQSEVNQHAQAA
jgi:ferritin-like metal-binding protein YciE